MKCKWINVSNCLRNSGVNTKANYANNRVGDNDLFFRSFSMFPNFLSSGQSTIFLEGKRFQKGHWDSVITGYREVERHHTLWDDNCRSIFSRVKEILPVNEFLQHIHVLELTKEGFISPHVDNCEAFGAMIATLSLQSDAIMTFEHTTADSVVDVFVPRGSLYIMGGYSRYMYKHSISNLEFGFEEGNDIIQGKTLFKKENRISVILRSEKEQKQSQQQKLRE